LTLSEIARFRLINQQLVDSKLQSPVEMVEWFCAVQGQEYAQTKWALGLRLPHLKDRDIEKDINDGKIVRTHLLRPTWHLVSAENIRWLLTLSAPRVHAANDSMYRKTELDGKIYKHCIDVLVKTLRGGKQLTRDEINKVFAANKIAAHSHRLSYIMMYAELEQIICSGSRRGNQFTYALLDERVKPVKTITKDEALSRLAASYFKSRGPSTVHDFSTWSGLTLTECKRGLDMIKDRLETISAGDINYYAALGGVIDKGAARNIHLLPIYDEYIMGYKDRTAILTYRQSLGNESPYMNDCTIIYNGQIIGTWRRTVKSNKIELDYDFFTELTGAQKNKFNDAIHRFSQFYELPVELQS
jgi:hypothetical protein